MSRAAFLKRINYLLISLLTYFKERQLVFRDQLRERHLLLDDDIVFSNTTSIIALSSIQQHQSPFEKTGLGGICQNPVLATKNRR